MMFARVDASPLGTGRFYTSDPRYQEADRLFHESIRYNSQRRSKKGDKKKKPQTLVNVLLQASEGQRSPRLHGRLPGGA